MMPGAAPRRRNQKACCGGPLPPVVANITFELAPGRFVFRQRHDGGDALALLQRQDVDQRLAASVGAATGNRQTFSL